VYVQPKASKTELVGVHGEVLKFRVAAPPVDGEANAVLCRYVAKLLAIPLRTVSVLAGQANRKKHIELRGVTEETVRKALGLPKVEK